MKNRRLPRAWIAHLVHFSPFKDWHYNFNQMETFVGLVVKIILLIESFFLFIMVLKILAKTAKKCLFSSFKGNNSNRESSYNFHTMETCVKFFKPWNYWLDPYVLWKVMAMFINRLRIQKHSLCGIPKVFIST